MGAILASHATAETFHLAAGVFNLIHEHGAVSHTGL
jgi:hypothetical protein